MRIVVDGLTKRYGQTLALDRVSFEALPGKVTGFLGPNGSGKSTTMRCLLGLATPDGGSALFDGRPYRALRAPLHRIGALLDPDAYHPARSGRDHLRVIATAAGLRDARVDETLELVELTRAARQLVGGYSLGMRQRLHLAAAMLGDPEVLVLDEPTNGLDPAGIRWLRDLLRAQAAEGRTVLLSSHVLPEVEQTVDEVLVIARGRIVARGGLHEILGGGGARLRVGSPDLARLGALLAAQGALVSRYDDALLIERLTAERVARTALDAGVLVTELAAEAPDLERAFFALTAEGAP